MITDSLGMCHQLGDTVLSQSTENYKDNKKEQDLAEGFIPLVNDY